MDHLRRHVVDGRVVVFGFVADVAFDEHFSELFFLHQQAQCLVDEDACGPCPQRAVAPELEVVDAGEHLDERLLEHVLLVVAVADVARTHRLHTTSVEGVELLHCLLFVVAKALG